MIKTDIIDANDSLTEVTWDDETYFLRMSWNSEGAFWTLSLEDYAHNVIVAGVLVVPGSPLLGMFRHLGVPPGELYAFLLDDTRGTLRRDDFVNGTAELIYVPV